MRLGSVLGRTVAVACLLASNAVYALQMDVESDASIKAAAAEVAYQMIKNGYTGNNTGDVPGNLPDPYFWWQCGGMMTTLVDYWYYTGDTSYNEMVSQAILWQVGKPATFMPSNQSKDEGNDDQGFWAFSAMTAAETNFKNPAEDQPQWLEMAQGVFNQQTGRWDTTSCGGGLKWQIFLTNNGYNYKNSISNGALFSIAARLAVYTENTTYAAWADKTWNWVTTIGLMDKEYNVFDGSNDLLNCSDFDHTQWSYNAGIFLTGAANMYKYTNGSDLWLSRVNGILNKTIEVFFTDDGIMYEQACENFEGQTNFCNNDQLSFKTYLAHWMAVTSQLVPSTAARIMPLLKSSAKAAAAQCTGGASGTVCGARWTSKHDGTPFNVGQQMSALSVIGALLQPKTAGLVTNSTGGTSVGDSSAGSSAPDSIITPVTATTAGKAGAGIFTAAILSGVVGGAFFMIKE